MVFKIEFEKAYDHVNWNFVDEVLERKGFKDRWRRWIRGCLSSVKFSVLVNGFEGNLGASRGLRQGDPLFPFLFTMVVDCSGRLVEKARVQGLIDGFRIGKDRVEHIYNLQTTRFSSCRVMNASLIIW